ncbi:MAG: TIGR04086 family membrane protein [Oscillospiraceae bacterium]|nr:TIGR04086 family membrane protein [Oscillospiraceae bacterium]
MKKVFPSPQSIPLSLVKGALSGFIALGVLSAAAAMLVSRGTVAAGSLKPAALVCVFCASVVSGFVTAKLAGRRVLLLGCAAGGILFFIFTAAQIMSDASAFPGSRTLAQLLATVPGGAVGSLFSLARLRSRRGRR